MALWDHPGGPWEQQDGHEVANNRIFVDFGVISGLVYVSFEATCLKKLFFSGLFPDIFLSTPDSTFGPSGLPNRCFALKVLQKSTFHGNRF